MEEAIFMEIANEIKGMNNQAIRLISQGRLAEAESVCQKALAMTKHFAYYDGMAMFFFNLANLEALRDDLLKAMTYGALCREMHEKAQTETARCDELLGSLAKAAMKKGIELEKTGMLKEALDYYYASVPFSEEKYRRAMTKEIELIERVINAGNG